MNSANPPETKEKKYLTKVVFHYSDGTAKYIDEDDLNLWLKYNRHVAAIANIRDCNPPWEIIKWRTADGKPCRY